MPSVTSAVEEEVRNIVDQMLVPVKADISTNAADLATVTSRVNNMTKEFTAMKENTTMELFWGTPSPEAVYQRTSDVSANVATFLQQAALAYANATGAPINFKIGNAAPSSFVEEGAPDSFADLDAKLKALEEKTKAELEKLQSDTAAPSSFVEEGAPDSFAGLDAQLKKLNDMGTASSFVEENPSEYAIAQYNALKDKMKQQMAAAKSKPSSLLEEGAPDSFADLDAKLKALEEKTKSELAKLQSDTAAPSSFVEEESMPSVTSAVEEEVRNIVDQMLVPVKADISTNAADLATVTSRVNNMTKEFTAMKENTTMELFWGTPSPEAVYQRTSDVSANVATFLQQAALAYANATGAPINF